MSFVILQAVMKRLEERPQDPDCSPRLGSTMKLPRSGRGRLSLEVIELADQERPPMIRIPEYLERHRPDDLAELGRARADARGAGDAAGASDRAVTARADAPGVAGVGRRFIPPRLNSPASGRRSGRARGRSCSASPGVTLDPGPISAGTPLDARR